MSDPASVRMTTDEFIALAMEQPEGQHDERAAGEVFAMAPERGGHALANWRRLTEAIEAAGCPCDAYPDGMTVSIDAATVNEPDVLVRCGSRVPDATIRLDDPVVVVEVFSPSTRSRESGVKLIDYVRLPSVHHQLIVRIEDRWIEDRWIEDRWIEDRAIIHPARNEDGTILSQIVRDEILHLDPPGITVTGLFAAAR